MPLAIAKRAVRVGASLLWHAPRLMLGAILQRRDHHYGSLLGAAMATVCEELGPTYIKVAQILSARPDLLTSEVADALGRLRDDVKPVPRVVLAPWLEESLGCSPEALFTTFEWRPLAAGSIAQVHAARLEDGSEVAVKVLRPGITELVDVDIRLLHAVAVRGERLPAFHNIPLADIINDVGRCVRQQADLRQEANNHRICQARYGNDPRVRIPYLIEELCTDRVLVMERINGLHRRAQGAELRAGVRLGLQLLFRMIFIDGFVHADMHSANVFFLPGPELALLDFGLIAALSSSQRRRFAEFFQGLVIGDGDACARILLESATVVSPAAQVGNFTRDVGRLVRSYAGRSASSFEVSTFVWRLFDVQRRSGVRGSPEFMMVIISLLVYEGMVKQLTPDLDFQAEARPYVLRAIYAPDPVAYRRERSPSQAGHLQRVT